MIKPIELTKKHKEMLLKMCRELFPEYSKIQFQDIYNNETGNLYFDNVNSGIIIHWFEFCLNNIAPKLMSLDNIGFHYRYIEESKTLIDYLYYRFIQIKFIKIKKNDNKKEKK